VRCAPLCSGGGRAPAGGSPGRGRRRGAAVVGLDLGPGDRARPRADGPRLPVDRAALPCAAPAVGVLLGRRARPGGRAAVSARCGSRPPVHAPYGAAHAAPARGAAAARARDPPGPDRPAVPAAPSGASAAQHLVARRLADPVQRGPPLLAPAICVRRDAAGRVGPCRGARELRRRRDGLLGGHRVPGPEARPRVTRAPARPGGRGRSRELSPRVRPRVRRPAAVRPLHRGRPAVGPHPARRPAPGRSPDVGDGPDDVRGPGPDPAQRTPAA